MTFDIRTVDLKVLNSATKYPSIPTYHEMDKKTGLLLESATEPLWVKPVLTEKVDGTNSRVIVSPEGVEGNPYIIGSRKELLYAEGDFIKNPKDGIVETLTNSVIQQYLPKVSNLLVLYFETYGHGIGKAAKEYSTGETRRVCLFDIACVPLDVLQWPVEQVTSWRDNGGQEWANEDALQYYAQELQLPLVPRISYGYQLPITIQETWHWLRDLLPSSEVPRDPDSRGRPEGIVLRTEDRKMIAKARFEDYDRTLKRKKQR